MWLCNENYSKQSAHTRSEAHIDLQEKIPNDIVHVAALIIEPLGIFYAGKGPESYQNFFAVSP
jgi:hypothetical protein